MMHLAGVKLRSKNAKTQSFISAISFAALFFILLVGLRQQALSQVNTADVVGTVSDVGGAVISGATVTIQNTATGAVRDAKTSDQGDYSFTLLPVGQYSVKVEMSGFKTFMVPSVALSGGDRARVDAHMQIGSVSQSVEVQDVLPALQTDSSVVGATVTSRSVQELPLNGRNFISLAQLAPGATPGGPNALSSGTRPDDRRSTSSISVNGNPETYNNYMIDGMDDNERFVGAIGVRPSLDAMAEFRVQTNLYAADVSRTAGGVVNIVTKSGGNNYHGSLFEYLRNDIFDGNTNYRFTSAPALPKGEYRQNQFGGSLGGPIQKDKTFFFGDYEGLRVVQGVAFTDRVLPSLKERTGDFSELSVPIVDPVTGTPFAGNIIPTNRMSTESLSLASLFPAPTSPAVGTANYASNVPRVQNGTTWDVRIDHRFSNTDTLFGRYSFNDVTTTTPSALPAVNGIFPVGCQCGGSGFSNLPTGNFSGTSKQRAQNLQLNYVKVMSSTTVLNLRAGWLRTVIQSLPDNGGKPNAAASVGIPNVSNGSIFTNGLPQIVLAPYASLGDFQYLPLFTFNNGYQYNGDVIHTIQRHSLRFGAQAIRRQLATGQTAQPRGQFVYSDAKPSGYNFGVGDAFAAFLLDTPVAFNRLNQQVSFHHRQWETSAYAQDDWRTTNWLTLNLGVRYDIFTPFTEVQDHMSNWDPVALHMVIASNSDPTAGVKTDYNNVSPRIGFAASLGKGMVVRGGYGISYFQGLVAAASFSKNQPFFFSSNGNCGPNQTVKCPTLTQGPVVPPSGVDPTLANNANLAGSISGVDPNFRMSYIQQFNLTVQKEWAGNVIGVGYVGNLGRKLPNSLNLNLPPSPSFGGASPARPYASILPLNPAINVIGSWGVSDYHAMQFTFERRVGQGLTVNAQHTWSHALSNVNGGNTSLSAGAGTGQWVSNWSSFDFGTSGFDIRHSTSVLLNYQLPFGKNLSGAAGVLAKGWEVNNVIVYRTGLPFTVVNSAGRLGITGGGADRPNQVSSIKYPKTLSEWFDPTAFAPNVIGQPGTERVYPGTSPNYRSWDFSANKRFHLTERFDLQFRAEVFNLLNMPNFAAPSTTMPGTFNPNDNTTWGTLGKISALAGPPRQMQFGLRLGF
jgi:outer membrane receptor protein involved in Fe transport